LKEVTAVNIVAMKKLMLALFLIVSNSCFSQQDKSMIITNRLLDSSLSVDISRAIDSHSFKASNIPKDSIKIYCCRRPDNAKAPLFILDDIPLAPEFDINTIDPQTIDSIYILKDKSAISLYGSRGEGGAVYIYTKDYLQEKKTTYEVTVFDPGYESFLLTQKPKSFYSEYSLKTKNILMVNEWNYRFNQPLRYNSNIYEVSINYDPKINYGLEFEYRLYMFFKFMEKQHHMTLLNSNVIAEIK